MHWTPTVGRDLANVRLLTGLQGVWCELPVRWRLNAGYLHTSALSWHHAQRFSESLYKGFSPEKVFLLFPSVIEATTAVLFFLQKVWREFPVFWSFLLFELIRTTALFAIGMEKPHYSTYFYLFWVTEGIGSLMAFFIVREVFQKAFSRRLGFERLGRTAFRTTILVLIAVALYSASADPGSDASKLLAGIYVIKRADSVLRIGLLAALLVFLFLLGIPWKERLIGIAMGLAVYDAIEIVGLAVRARYGREGNGIYTWSRLVANLCQKVIWAIYFLRPPRRPPTMPNGRVSLNQVEAMKQAVEVALER